MTNFQTKALMVPPVEVKILEIFLPELRVIDLASVFRQSKVFPFWREKFILVRFGFFDVFMFTVVTWNRPLSTGSLGLATIFHLTRFMKTERLSLFE